MAQTSPVILTKLYINLLLAHIETNSKKTDIAHHGLGKRIYNTFWKEKSVVFEKLMTRLATSNKISIATKHQRTIFLVFTLLERKRNVNATIMICLLYTSDAADEL